eukprot:PhF_6_TR22578/c0_g1_i3/m.32175
MIMQEEESSVWSIVLHEIARHNYVNCTERGLLLEYMASRIESQTRLMKETINILSDKLEGAERSLAALQKEHAALDANHNTLVTQHEKLKNDVLKAPKKVMDTERPKYHGGMDLDVEKVTDTLFVPIQPKTFLAPRNQKDQDLFNQIQAKRHKKYLSNDKNPMSSAGSLPHGSFHMSPDEKIIMPNAFGPTENRYVQCELMVSEGSKVNRAVSPVFPFLDLHLGPTRTYTDADTQTAMVRSKSFARIVGEDGNDRSFFGSVLKSSMFNSKDDEEGDDSPSQSKSALKLTEKPSASGFDTGLGETQVSSSPHEELQHHEDEIPLQDHQIIVIDSGVQCAFEMNHVETQTMMITLASPVDPNRRQSLTASVFEKEHRRDVMMSDPAPIKESASHSTLPSQPAGAGIILPEQFKVLLSRQDLVARPRNAKWVHSLLMDLFMHFEVNVDHQALTQFVNCTYNFFRHKYGLAKMADGYLVDFLMASLAMKTSNRVLMFMQWAHLAENFQVEPQPTIYTTEALVFFLHVAAVLRASCSRSMLKELDESTLTVSNHMFVIVGEKIFGKLPAQITKPHLEFISKAIKLQEGGVKVDTYFLEMVKNYEKMMMFVRSLSNFEKLCPWL